MDQSMLENNYHAFIVRIWFEPREIQTMPSQWRGMVQYVASGEQRYFNSFEQLISFVVKNAGLPEPYDFDPGK
jgi:hypothetical protein